MYNGNMPARRGFTLIELLVVIAIIGVLSSVILASLNSARVKARNANRVSQIQELGKGFALAFDSQNAYPSSGSAWVCVSASCSGSWASYAANATVDAATAKYISKPQTTNTGLTAGGYLYDSLWSASPAPSGITFKAGPYLLYMLEGSNTSCGPGQQYTHTTTYTECAMLLP